MIRLQPSARMHRLFASLVVGLALLLLGAALLVYSQRAAASSHREAPLIARDPYADNTDVYAWMHGDNVVIVANWIPFESPDGGPNYFAWDDHVLYDIHVDNDGDARADVTYTLSSQTRYQNDETFLYNTGPIDSLDDMDWNQRQTISVTEQFEGQTLQTFLVADKPTTPVHIGSKSTPNYENLVSEAIYTYSSPQGPLKIFAGQRDDPFWVDLQVFDLLTLRGQDPPIGYVQGNNIPIDSLSGYNVHAFVLEVPKERLVRDDPVLGIWATARRAGLTVVDPGPGDYKQVSRLGMPLTNEVVMPLALKDVFNAIRPGDDLSLYSSLQKYVEDPQIGTLLCGLYGIHLPADADDDCHSEHTPGTPRSGRGDIFDIFLTGMELAAPFTIQTASGPATLPAGENINRPMNGVPAEMLRLNTGVGNDLCHPTSQRLGLLAGDACGFPNGRRLTDDVVDIELLAVAGAAYGALDGRDTAFNFDPALIEVLGDHVDTNDRPFLDEFPYLATPHSGQERLHQNPLAAVYLPFQSHGSMAAVAVEMAQQNPVGVTLVMAGSVLLVGAPVAWLRRRKERGQER